MLSKAILFSFCFLGMFALLFAAVPLEFRAHQQAWSPTYFATDEEVAAFFNAHNITLYSSSSAGALNYPEAVEVQAGLPPGQNLRIWWEDHEIYEYGGLMFKSLGISYQTQHYFLGVWQYWTHEDLHYLKNGVNRGDYIVKDVLVNDFETSLNGTYYDARCNSGIQVSILYTGNETTIGESWDANKLNFMISYELNATASAINMFTLLGEILTFQAPSLGISGWLGYLFNQIIAIPIYALSGYLIYKLITGIAPFLSGGSGD
jgi:hypothetical protein